MASAHDVERAALQPRFERNDRTMSGKLTNAIPTTKAGPGMKLSVGIHLDRGKEISVEIAGINRKNIVTVPLSLFVSDNANW